MCIFNSIFSNSLRFRTNFGANQFTKINTFYFSFLKNVVIKKTTRFDNFSRHFSSRFVSQYISSRKFEWTLTNTFLPDIGNFLGAPGHILTDWMDIRIYPENFQAIEANGVDIVIA